MKRITNHHIIIADSQFLVVEALKLLIDSDERYTLAGVAWNLQELHMLLKKFRSGLLIMDFANMDFQGIDDLKWIRQKYPLISVLVLTNSLSNVEMAALTKVGIRNVIYKTAAKEEVIEAFDSTLKGVNFYSNEISDLPADLLRNNYQIDFQQLTSTEYEIVKLIANGFTTKKIAAKKNISHHTVNTHRRNIFKKVEVSNASELILHAIKSGWIENVEYSI